MILGNSKDKLLIISTLGLVAFGAVMVYSTSYVVAMRKFGDGFYFVEKQIIFALIGFSAFLAASRMPYEFYKKLTYPLLILSAVFLVMLMIPGMGHSAGGAKRWLKLPGFTFQPSEFAKFAVVVFMAYSLEAKKNVIKDFSLGFLPNIIIPGVIIALIMREPDFGTAVTLGFLVFIMNFIAGVRLRYLGGLALAAIPVFYVVVTNFSYMMKRLLIFLDPWADPDGAGFQIVQSFIAFGSGGIWGVGLGDGLQKLLYLPEAHTDFIFSIIGEEFGLVGVTVMVALYIAYLICGVKIASSAKDLFGKYLALGLTFMVSLQALINMAVVLGILPPKGLPLPFISYGGTSLIVSMFSSGVLLNICIKGNES